MPKTAFLTIKIEPELLAQARERARHEDRSVSALLRRSLAQYLAETGKGVAA